MARVGVSVSLAVLLVLTTPWADMLKSLRLLRVPQIFVLVLSMTYRYIFLFLHTANGMLLARKSRMVARTSGGEERRWIGGSMGNLMSRLQDEQRRLRGDDGARLHGRGPHLQHLSHDRARLAGIGGCAASLAAAAVVAGRPLA